MKKITVSLSATTCHILCWIKALFIASLPLTQFQPVDFCKPKMHFWLGCVCLFMDELMISSANLSVSRRKAPRSAMWKDVFPASPAGTTRSSRVKRPFTSQFQLQTADTCRFDIEKQTYHSDSHNISKFEYWSFLEFGSHGNFYLWNVFAILPGSESHRQNLDTEFMTRTPIRSSTSAICLRRLNKHHQGWWLSHYSEGFNHPRVVQDFVHQHHQQYF